MKTKWGVRCLAATLMMVTVSACGQSEVTEEDIAKNLSDMSVSKESSTEITQQKFCEQFLKSYGDYGKTVSERAVIQSKAGSGEYSASDIYENVQSQQKSIQSIENLTKQHEVTDNADLEKARKNFIPSSTKMIKAYQSSKKNGNLQEVDPAIKQWELGTQPIAIECSA